MPTRAGRSHLASLAVFSRNHKAYLEAAAKVGSNDPDQPVVLRSRKKWVTAEKALRVHGPTAIYFAVVDGGPSIQYEAVLVEVQLDPDLQDPTTRRLLSHVAELTQAEGLWQGEAQTLYAIRECHRVKQPFRLSELVKYHNGELLSDDYLRSYSLVMKRAPVTG